MNYKSQFYYEIDFAIHAGLEPLCAWLYALEPSCSKAWPKIGYHAQHSMSMVRYAKPQIIVTMKVSSVL